MKVLVVDDSALVRLKISEILKRCGFNVFTAKDGEEMLEKIPKIDPDVITLDVKMPRMDGLTALEKMMKDKPRPVIMLSSLTYEGAKETIEALRLGAVDFIAKPRGGIEEIAEEIVRKVKIASTVNPNIIRLQNLRKLRGEIVRRDWKVNKEVCVIIGSSTGGPSALEHVIPRLPSNFPVPVFVVQHMPPNFTRHFAERINDISEIEVKEAEDNERVEKGVVYIAPGGKHMKLRRSLNVVRVKIFDDKPVNNVKPSIDVTAYSIAQVYGGNVVGVILTGMGEDGARGMKMIHDLGGKVIACNEETCVVFGMPKAAIEIGAVDSIKPIFEIVEEVARFIEVVG
ncbi:MAG: chemotaxis response regulator protein-glutamate methylesterase [Archaeoglobaceae archaeon]|nr:chemotaxis response regulator protein-glutamate methylesterase [Archaeoglobaceae archaeon]MDW7989083.1 chemotaxis response regulator protein-glutamate methylesterase [Archaeoglobaceae archaeon]